MAFRVEVHDLPIVRACQIAGCSRTAWYRPAPDRSAQDQPVIEALLALVARPPHWGFWKYAGRLCGPRGWN